jgi:hypothetical protein
MAEEFDFDEIRLPPETETKPRSKRTHDDKGQELHIQLQIWHWHFLRDRRTGGRVLRFFLMLAEADFRAYGKPFKVTSAMMTAAGVGRKYKAELLRMFEAWGFLFLDAPPDKNPIVSWRKRRGRGTNPLQRSE